MKLFPAFISGNKIRSLVNDLFGVNIFDPFHSSTYSSSSSGGMSNKSSSSAFYLLNFTLSTIVSSSCDLLSFLYILLHLS